MLHRPIAVDRSPTMKTRSTAFGLELKTPGVMTVKDEISWLERIQYIPEPVARRLRPDGILTVFYPQTFRFCLMPRV